MSKDFRGASGQEQSCELNRIKSPALSYVRKIKPPLNTYSGCHCMLFMEPDILIKLR